MSLGRALPQRNVAAHAPFSDGEWVSRIRESDRDAFEALVRHYSDRLCAFIYSNTHDAEVTRELVQDLFLWIWRHRHQWDVHSGLTTYLYRSARNRAVSHLRHERLQRRWREEQERNGAFATNGAEPPRSDEAIRVAELSRAIEGAIASMPQRCREVFILNREHHLTYREVAETLDISVKTVEVHMGRALAVLRIRLSDWIS
jgi:RNA polymerase sigma-70 factor (ECF subfamily)